MGNMRILGLDVGDKRVGVAINDPMGWGKAQPLATLERKNLLHELPKIIEEYNIEKIVIGIPHTTGEKLSAQAKKIARFSKEIEKTMKLPIVLWDETLSSVEAEEILISADVSRKKRKKLSDKVAATLILQSYLLSCHSEEH